MRESRKSGFCEGRTTARGASTRPMKYKQVIEMGWKKAIAAGIMFVFVFTIGKNFSISIFYTFVEILIGAIVYVIVLVVLRDAFVCKYIDKTFHKILGQRRK